MLSPGGASAGTCRGGGLVLALTSLIAVKGISVVLSASHRWAWLVGWALFLLSYIVIGKLKASPPRPASALSVEGSGTCTLSSAADF